MSKVTRKNEAHPSAVFSTRALLRDGRYAKGEFRVMLKVKIFVAKKT